MAIKVAIVGMGGIGNTHARVYMQDPRAELVERLIEYQEFKMMASKLQEYFFESEGAFFHEQELPREVREYVPDLDLTEFLSDVTLERIRDVFTMVIRRQEEKKQHASLTAAKRARRIQARKESLENARVIRELVDGLDRDAGSAARYDNVPVLRVTGR